jgi:hypothetical protein
MYIDLVIWDDENEPHIIDPGEVTVDEVDEVIRNHPGDHDSPDEFSDASSTVTFFLNTVELRLLK